MIDPRNHFVSFRISDIHLPEPGVVLYQLHRDEMLRGRVVDISDGGAPERRFVLVEVKGVTQLIVVPAGRIVLVND